jgi:hypothetical protein
VDRAQERVALHHLAVERIDSNFQTLFTTPVASVMMVSRKQVKSQYAPVAQVDRQQFPKGPRQGCMECRFDAVLRTTPLLAIRVLILPRQGRTILLPSADPRGNLNVVQHMDQHIAKRGDNP